MANQGTIIHFYILFGAYALHWLDTAKAAREKNALLSCFIAILYSCELAHEEILALTSFDFNFSQKEISIKKIAQLIGDTEKVVLDVYNHIMEDREDATAKMPET